MEKHNREIAALADLFDRQRTRGCDLYEGISSAERDRLIALKSALVTYLVRLNRIEGRRASLDAARKKWDSYRDRLGISADLFCGKSVLEVGCGNSAALHGCAAQEIVNLDPLMDVYSKHIEGFPELFPDITFVTGPAESIPFPDERFDLLVCVNALDHVNDAARAVAEMSRVLRPQALLLLNVDCKDRTNDRAMKRLGHPYSFTPGKLKQLFNATVFELLSERMITDQSSVTMHFQKSSVT